MAGLTHDDFSRFFAALWGYQPFPWQQRLIQLLATGKDPVTNHQGQLGRWPDLLNLPTGAGKTAALDVAVFHLALDALQGDGRRAPMRIAFVIDRRLIVDDAHARAARIAQALNWSLLEEDAANRLEAKNPELSAAMRRVRAEPVVERVASRLAELAGRNQPPLIARGLRGGAPREDDWSHTPVQPAILCSTVDQVGSRLLFRGYGLSDRMRPVHAGLLGSDCLILLDEAHLSEPFRQTLEALALLREPDEAPFGFAVLTATPSIVPQCRFDLGAEDLDHPILSARITASKPARLVEVRDKQGMQTEDLRAEVIVGEVTTVLSALQTQMMNPAVGVVTNRVARARAVFERLRRDLMGRADVRLLIGPARAVDREKRAVEIESIHTRHPDAARGLPRPLIVVATQTIEAGVDIDFDGLVTEAAALDALRQRFGRVNRGGRKIKVEATIVAHIEDVRSSADDAVYGDRIAKTWLALKRLEERDPAHLVDFGIAAMNANLPSEEVSELASVAGDAPILLPAYADLWSRTWPIPDADPDVALFLHGPNRSPASVQIVWRADIEVNDLQSAKRLALIDLLALVPPRAAEAIEVPIWVARAWLLGIGVGQNDFSDAVEREPTLVGERGAGRRAFRWAGQDSDQSGVVYASQLRNGDMIVVPAGYGGCDDWGWNPKSQDPVADVAEEAAWPYRGGRFAVRITPQLILQGFHREAGGNRAATAKGLAATDRVLTKLAEHSEDKALRLLNVILASELPATLKTNLDALARPRAGRLDRVFAYGFNDEGLPRSVIFGAPRGVAIRREVCGDLAALPTTEIDEASISADRPVGLVDHCQHVGAWAEDFASRAGLPAKQSDDVIVAARLHDLGKADPRFQAFLSGGDPYGPDTTQLLAKSGQRVPPADAWDRSGLPRSWRHEALSVRLAMIHPEFTRAHDPTLVLWLIGTHHGFGRPLFPHADDRDTVERRDLLKIFGSSADLPPGHGPQSLAFDFEGMDWVQIFERLKQNYGIWGLARLEAFVRLADHRASAVGAPPELASRHKEAAE
ncbi:MAG TPA: type I-U CRISPR-associated helicase/endonuclease Cas3 [Xanthobacteraceae bacterium]|nr:type I-U CRISPR-associated helicase/endonuclease Cas3 [Xanthobacteraceae bacterium]